MSGPLPVRAPLGGRSALLTYEPYYGLKEKPFSLSVDPRFLYKSRSHAPVFDDLLAGICRREGLIVLTGDIGTGKTTLCRAVLENLDRKTFSTFVPDPFVSREDLLKMLLIDFGVMSVDDLKSGRLSGASRPDLSYPLYEFLNSLVPLQAFAVLIIDEAQNLSLPLLEEIRILSDLEAPEKLLQVVLVGQLEFQAKLKLPEMRQVDQRVSVRCNLEPLKREAVGAYITHRLQVAGGTSDRVSFAPGAVELIDQKSGGVPRLINLICDRSLHRGHLARASVIDADIVRVAIIDLGLSITAPLAAFISETEEPPPAAAPVAPVRSPSADPKVAPATPTKELEDKPEPIVFEEHDLIHADQATPLEVASPTGASKADAAKTPASPDAADRPLLFETRGGTWSNNAVTSRHRWQRRTRRIAVAAAALAIVALASFLQAQWDTDLQSEWAPEPPASPLESAASVFQPKPVLLKVPPTPAEVPASSAIPHTSGSFEIDVALFSSAARASRLVNDLAAANYPAYVKDLSPNGERGHLYEVAIGPFASRDKAEADLAHIHALAGYDDARVVPSGP